ncbi:Crp/Fnr family transcriptional regulator [Fulvivirgaceae bacterium BMA10]|uniref:Crp/Fnr family transcriptional regulator n=1 Tax=Splendidivirga corallicola TaxID=3051826 RepID=A0ABT8KU90_9BACT|nr:Crp/Fnr family transcriptional regulator [Fulvivirgaceae bacterium BMA10]
MSTQSNLWYFEDVDLYDILCPHKVEGMQESHTFNKFKKDEFIYFPDEPSDHIYLVSEGRIKIGAYTEDGREVVKTILSPGEVFGELALVGEEKRTDFAIAMDHDTRVCPMNISDMQQLMAINRDLSLKIFKLIGFRIKKLERRIESLVFKDARSRIVDFIRDLAYEKGKKVGFETLIKNHFTHQDIANLTGTSRQTVTTILNELKDQNLINFDRRRILVRDLDKLH